MAFWPGSAETDFGIRPKLRRECGKSDCGQSWFVKVNKRGGDMAGFRGGRRKRGRRIWPSLSIAYFIYNI